jgi:hypothetical protein
LNQPACTLPPKKHAGRQILRAGHRRRGEGERLDLFVRERKDVRRGAAITASGSVQTAVT